MNRPDFEIASVIKRYGADYRMQHHPNNYQLTVLNALQQCRTAELGGHKDRCDNDSCAHERFSYNSCGNRHCPSPRWIFKVITQPVLEIYLSTS
jgi:hypothetical protein